MPSDHDGEDERTKRPTAPMVLPPGDRVIIDNQIRVLAATFEQYKADRNDEIDRFNKGRMLPLERDFEARTRSAVDRSNVAFGVAIASLTFGVALLVLVCLLLRS